MPPDLATVVDVRVGGESHPGRSRVLNEDRFHADPLRGVFIVVDGIGGQAGGARAAEIAVDAVRRRLERETASVPERLREAIASANEAIYDESLSRPGLAGMGCVVTAAVIDGDRIVAGHVGDTRLYKLRGGNITKLTRDHSPVGDLEDGGRIGEREAMRHPRRNEVWRSVGSARHRPEDPGFIDIVEDSAEADAAFLLCSDGLTDAIGSAEIAAAIYRNAGSPTSAAHELIEAANKAGGHDNVTALVIEGPSFTDARAHTPRPLEPVRERAGTLSGFALPFALGAAVVMLAITSPPRQLTPAQEQAEAVRAVVPTPRTLRVGGPDADVMTITAALETAQAGDTILVEPGTYREAITLRDGVAIVSVQRHAAELRRPANHAGPWTAVVVEKIGGGVIRGLRIAGNEAEPLDIGVQVRDADAAIEDLDVSGAREVAVRIGGSSAATVHGCVLHDNPGVGIQVRDTSAPEITNTAVVRNVRGAIDVSPGARPTLLWNVVQHANRPR